MFTKSIFAATAALSMSRRCLCRTLRQRRIECFWKGTTTLVQLLISTLAGGDLGEDASWYVQGGPAILAIDSAENGTRYSARLVLLLTDSLGIYGELSALTASDSFEMDDLGVGGKLGATFSF